MSLHIQERLADGSYGMVSKAQEGSATVCAKVMNFRRVGLSPSVAVERRCALFCLFGVFASGPC
jgi:hypothetical protein